MTHFSLITHGLNVAPLLAELDAHPELWNHRPERRAGNSPHRETQDIWLRYASEDAMQRPNFINEPHDSIWWPASDSIPAVYQVIRRVRKVLGEPLQMGGILITRIPAGCQVHEHHDRGSWHAHHYDLKTWVVLRANERCVNWVEDESMVWKPGECWHHDNLLNHKVENRGDAERITLILCFRRGAI